MTKRTAKPARNDAKVPRATVRAVMLRDRARCVYCLATDALSVDHVIPRVEGGSNAVSNLVTACGTCNSLRGACPIDLWAEWCERRGVGRKSRILTRVALAIATDPATVLSSKE